ncbi:pectinesterase-like protein, partial [Tanacetum coccineum]
QVDPILVWLTAARAYQTTCVDEITDEKLKKDIKKTLDAANKHTFNSEKIIYNVPKILKDFGVDLSDYKLPPIGHRRLLDEGEELDQQGYPSWVTASDRRILGGDSKDRQMMMTKKRSNIIFGSGRAFFQDTKINVRKPQTGQSNTITADGRMKTEEMGGVVLHNCKIMAAPELKSAKGQFKTYLGRPWKEEQKAIEMKIRTW